MESGFERCHPKACLIAFDVSSIKRETALKPSPGWGDISVAHGVSRGNKQQVNV